MYPDMHGPPPAAAGVFVCDFSSSDQTALNKLLLIDLAAAVSCRANQKL
jgi:hypothetical protein